MSRINIILSVVLLSLGGILFILEKPWAQDAFEQGSARISKSLFEHFDTSKAANIVIKQGANEVQLKKTAQGWVLPSLGDFKANEDTVTRLLNRVHDMTRGDLVSNDASQHARYRVTDTDAPRVKISDAAGAVLADFLQGKPYFDSEQISEMRRISQLDCYIRAAGSNEVYRISPFETVEPVRVNEWLPRNLFKFDVSAVQSMAIEGSGVAERIAINHLPNGTWDVNTDSKGPAPAKKESCETLARSVSSLYLQDVLGGYREQDAARYGFDHPAFLIKIELAGGTSEQLIIGKDIEKDSKNSNASDESAYALGGIAKQHVSKVFKSSLESLKVTRDQLAAPPPESKPASSPASSQPASQPAK
ncbi:MAG: DUF4340 domain-containing protein [Planctomycetes bacterium]|nr:DUF4340 domain-containing protein [Planctomycetota bacterium]